MLKSKTWLMAMGVAVGVFAASNSASAFVLDTRILIDRVANSPTLTVKYSGANARTVELRVNGVSYATRTVDANRDNGETTFNVIMSELKEGANDIEVVLYDANGRRISSERGQIVTEQGIASPISIEAPKSGAEVRGPVEINLGFNRRMSNIYVSFFINNDLKLTRNFAPYTYIWDTTLYPNGWHELEAWVVDETSSTYKTKKVRVFVNNPGGRTNRVDPTTTTPVVDPVVKPEPKPKPVLTETPNPVRPSVGSGAGAQAITPPASAASGPKNMAPTGTRVATQIPVQATEVTNVTSSLGTALIAITTGTRLPDMASFAITLNAKPVKFDVNPRVTNGVPLTPFRHLLEAAGGEVSWSHLEKIATATHDGRTIWIKIGDSTAKINDLPVNMEMTPFIERSRTVVPLSFIREALDVEIDFDPKTGHVLITSAKSKPKN